MDVIDASAIATAAVAAGVVNAMVGSGTLITFPTLVALGYPPVLANVSNSIGLVPGVLSAAYGYRRELVGQGPRLVKYGAASLLGGLAGAVLLLQLPTEAFDRAIPVLILAACALIALQPRLGRWLKQRDVSVENTGTPLWFGVLGTGIYGGYFGAAQGVLLIGLFGTFLQDSMQRLNAMKNVLATIVNGSAAVVFIAVADIDWAVVAIIAAGSTLGGLTGARFARGLPPTALRAVIIVVGVTASAFMIGKLWL